MTPEDNFDIDDDYNDDEGLLSCPKCGRDYDDIDYDFQACSKCGWDSEKNQYKNRIVRRPNNTDYMNGDADILTGDWI